MRKRKIFAIITMLALLCAVPAKAAGVSGRMVGSAIEVTWQIPAGTGELTVTRNDWPVWTGNVNGGSGSVTVPVDDPGGSYSLRLMTPEGCYAATVSGGRAATETTAVATEQPAAIATPRPTEAPTKAPEKAPEAKPAAKDTRKSVSAVNRDDLATQVLQLVNEERASRGLSALRMDSELTRAACVRAGEIAQSFSHTRPDGASWSTVSADAYGENIAMGQKTAEKVIAAWMTSTSHRENILRKSYGSIGICAYRSNGVMYWVQLFGK